MCFAGFTFKFSFTNNTSATIIVSPEFVNDDFFRVYSINESKKQDYGKPYSGIWREFVGTPKDYELETTEVGKLQCPWVFQEDQYTKPFCASESKDYLSMGRYFTNLSLDFSYKKGAVERRIKNLDLKINFEIK